ncbi:acyltransferase family protein, partial [Escherichia coli]|nr:acyltransferase family protein [Escherichia coli]
MSNYFFASESGYFSPDVELKPFLHTWSLAVEEQFYLIYPLLLAVLWRFGLKVVLYVILIIGIVSFIYADHGSFFDPINSFYSIM